MVDRSLLTGIRLTITKSNEVVKSLKKTAVYPTRLKLRSVMAATRAPVQWDRVGVRSRVWPAENLMPTQVATSIFRTWGNVQSS